MAKDLTLSLAKSLVSRDSLKNTFQKDMAIHQDSCVLAGTTVMVKKNTVREFSDSTVHDCMIWGQQKMISNVTLTTR